MNRRSSCSRGAAQILAGPRINFRGSPPPAPCRLGFRPGPIPRGGIFFLGAAVLFRRAAIRFPGTGIPFPGAGILFLGAAVLFLTSCSPSAEAPEAQAVRDALDGPGSRQVPDTGAPDPSAETGARTPGPQDPGERAKGPRVVFLGTSLTAGLGLLREEDGYVGRLSAMADSAGVPMQAVNAGVSGDTSAGGLRRLEWVLREALDILVVELGANDGLRGQDPNATAENLREIIRAARARYPDAAVLVAAMESPTNLGDAYNERFRALFPAVARDTGATLIPFFLDGVAGVPELNQEDGIHPTPEGHRMMARNLWPYLEPALREWWGEG